MSSRRVLGHARPNGAAACAELYIAALFTLLWDALADVLGTAATATLLRRTRAACGTLIVCQHRPADRLR